MSVNKAILIGRLGQDPELKYTAGGKAVCNFTLATSHKFGENETTTWHKCVAWEKQAEVIKENVAKGQEIYIEGRIDNRTYDKKDGSKGYISEVVVQNFQFVGSKGEKQDSKPESQPEGEGGEDLPF